MEKHGLMGSASATVKSAKGSVGMKELAKKAIIRCPLRRDP
jgi:hypothetical protein